ncbi:MAG: SDR family NAD(P)-dependent oxidoreductase [Deltaproteobacteria bacterium]|nr:SDR family NAD(P)-dependent oxidoreductase [Deltaproteobacteria bacterium]
MSNTPGRRVALVTGGSAGIGKAIALLLVEKNHDIALVARRAEPLDACAEKIRAKGARALTLPLDVADDAAFSAALDRTESEWGPIDLFVASAGIGYATPATDFDLGAAQAIVDLNVSAFTRNVAAVLARMVERNHGHIVALSSLAGYRGLPGNAAYCASKAYVSAFMESVRLDLRRTKVKTTTVHPGWVQTEMIARNEKKKPMVMRPERVAELVWDAVRGGKSSVSMPFPLNAWTRMGRHSPNLLFDVSMRGKRWPFDA